MHPRQSVLDRLNGAGCSIYRTDKNGDIAVSIGNDAEYSFTSGSQAKTYAFDKVAGGAQNGYVKATFEVTVFSGTLTNIQFNLCTDTDGATVVANSNKAWAEDGTKITSSGGQISMGNCTDKKTVTIVTTFPWASGNWDLQSIRLQLYGTKLQAGVSNIQVTLTEGTYEQ